MTTATSGERVLIVEDEPATRLGLTELVGTWGFTTASAADGEEALRCVTSFRPAIIISDLVMPRMGGLDLLRALKDEGGDLTIVILTAQGTVETAVDAIKKGAYDYLTKPVEPQRLKIMLEKIVERTDTLREVKVLRRQLRDHGTFGPMIGSSPLIRKVYQVVEQAAPTSASVLIWGESGTGKELVVQTVHQLSRRAQMPFVPLNCAAIPESLLESEIFGHEKGAFTGAFDRRQGCFELADRGTLLLDEIAEMTPATQVKLLRVLQERLAPLDEPVPEVVEVPAAPVVEPLPPSPPANREAGRGTRAVTGREPAAAQAPIEPEPLEPLELRASPSGSAGVTERGVRDTLAGALRDLSGVDYGSLSADGRAQYLQSRRFAEQAAEALEGRNIEFAATLADKSASLAAELRGR